MMITRLCFLLSATALLAGCATTTSHELSGFVWKLDGKRLPHATVQEILTLLEDHPAAPPAQATNAALGAAYPGSYSYVSIENAIGNPQAKLSVAKGGFASLDANVWGVVSNRYTHDGTPIYFTADPHVADRIYELLHTEQGHPVYPR